MQAAWWEHAPWILSGVNKRRRGAALADKVTLNAPFGACDLPGVEHQLAPVLDSKRRYKGPSAPGRAHLLRASAFNSKNVVGRRKAESIEVLWDLDGHRELEDPSACLLVGARGEGCAVDPGVRRRGARNNSFCQGQRQHRPRAVVKNQNCMDTGWKPRAPGSCTAHGSSWRRQLCQLHGKTVL